MPEPFAEVAARRSPRVDLELASFDEIGEEWDSLAAASGDIFATREWLRTWVEHFGDDPLVVACRTADGQIVAILPLEVRRLGGVRVLRFLGHGPSDQMGPVCAPGDMAFAVEAIRALLRRPPRPFRLFVGRHLPHPHDWAALLDARSVTTEPSPVLTFESETWDDVLSSFGSGIRKELRYDARRLAREHDVGYRRCDDAGALPHDLNGLIGLHALQWGKSSSFLRSESFHRTFAALALERGWLRLWSLEVDGRTVAAKLNFRYCGAEFSYQSGRDPAWRGPSLGLVNLSNAMRAAFEEGAREYRFLRGGERYKFRFPVAESAVQTVARGRGAFGRTLLAGGLGLEKLHLARTARRVLRRRLPG